MLIAPCSFNVVPVCFVSTPPWIPCLYQQRIPGAVKIGQHDGVVAPSLLSYNLEGVFVVRVSSQERHLRSAELLCWWNGTGISSTTWFNMLWACIVSNPSGNRCHHRFAKGWLTTEKTSTFGTQTKKYFYTVISERKVELLRPEWEGKGKIRKLSYVCYKLYSFLIAWT